MKFHYNDNKYLDREHLEFFIERFWRVIIQSHLKVEKGQEFYVHFRLLSKDIFFLSKLMILTNDDQSLDTLKREILCGPLGTILNIYESIDMYPTDPNKTQCYFHYKLKS